MLPFVYVRVHVAQMRLCVCEYACEISLGPFAEDIGLFCAKYKRQPAYQHGSLRSNPTGLECGGAFSLLVILNEPHK